MLTASKLQWKYGPISLSDHFQYFLFSVFLLIASFGLFMDTCDRTILSSFLMQLEFLQGQVCNWFNYQYICINLNVHGYIFIMKYGYVNLSKWGVLFINTMILGCVGMYQSTTPVVPYNLYALATVIIGFSSFIFLKGNYKLLGSLGCALAVILSGSPLVEQLCIMNNVTLERSARNIMLSV